MIIILSAELIEINIGSIEFIIPKYTCTMYLCNYLHYMLYALE
jgi:hypothetical protein